VTNGQWPIDLIFFNNHEKGPSEILRTGNGIALAAHEDPIAIGFHRTNTQPAEAMHHIRSKNFCQSRKFSPKYLIFSHRKPNSVPLRSFFKNLFHKNICSSNGVLGDEIPDL
jgi:hypothetical protein